jgi:hypothetical protein
MVIYEWKDAPYLGKVTSMTDDTLPVRDSFWTQSDLILSTERSRKRTSAQRMLYLGDFVVRMNLDDLFLTFQKE